MEDDARIRPLSAMLLPDCSIEVELSLPGWDEPQLSRTDQSTDFLTRVGSTRRPVNLDGGDRTDELAREHITRHLVQIERRLASQRRYEQYRQRQTAPALADYEPYAC
jgi:hypothetical protein